MITFVGEAIATICFIIAVVLMIIDMKEYSTAMIILMCVGFGVLFLFVAPMRWDLSKRIRQYQNDGSYKNYPVDHPYSFLYPGEPYPFPGAASNYTHTTYSATHQQSAPPRYTQQSTTNVPTKVVVSCMHCKQKLRVPTDKGTITVTCPSCKNSFKYTPNK